MKTKNDILERLSNACLTVIRDSNVGFLVEQVYGESDIYVVQFFFKGDERINSNYYLNESYVKDDCLLLQILGFEYDSFILKLRTGEFK